MYIISYNGVEQVIKHNLVKQELFSLILENLLRFPFLLFLYALFHELISHLACGIVRHIFNDQADVLGFKAILRKVNYLAFKQLLVEKGQV